MTDTQDPNERRDDDREATDEERGELPDEIPDAAEYHRDEGDGDNRPEPGTT